MGSLPSDMVFDADTHAGLVGRLLVLSYTGWIACVAWHTIKLHTTGKGDRPPNPA